MLRRAKQIHVKAADKIDKAKNIWKERYQDERKKTTQLEQECTKYRDMLEKLHRELLAKTALELGNNRLTGKARLPSKKVSAEISIARLLQEIEDLKRQVESNRFRLTAETKLKCVVEKDVKILRQELIKKKIQITLTRNQEQSAADNSKRNSYIKVV